MKDGKKPFDELSITAKYHTAPKLFGENIPYPLVEPEMMEIRNSIHENILNAPKGREGLSTQEGKHMEKIIQDVLSVELNDLARNDPKEKKKLDLCKDRIRHYVVNVLDSIKTYIGTILYLEEAAKRGYKEEIAKADDQRRLSHNSLIENINILNRSLLWWFGKFDPNLLSESQLAMYEKQEETLISDKIQRIEIPSNGICPPSFSISNRTEITRWAKAIYKDLITIRKLGGPVD